MEVVKVAKAFAIGKHTGQVRRYTGEPYRVHLEEVVSLIEMYFGGRHDFIAIAWLHDVLEDTPTTVGELKELFPGDVVRGVIALSDLQPLASGNRAKRKAEYREQIARSPWWVQTVKVADLISNTSSIVLHDPKFAAVYLQEKRELLDSLIDLHNPLKWIAYRMIDLSEAVLGKAKD